MTSEGDSLLRCVEIDPPGPARWSVIWLHGLGADGHDFEPIVPELGIPPGLGVRFVFPHAPSIPVTLNGGMVMPSWYDITEIDLRRSHDEAGVRSSAARVRALMQREFDSGIAPDRLVLAGFSQGGAVALHQGLRNPERLAGLLLLSTYLVCEDSLEEELAAANRDVPIFLAHGSMDPMVPLQRGRAAHDRLIELGYDVAWHDYPMGHAVCLEEITAAGQWLRERVV